MANQEHLNILMKGVKDWNQWREENSDISPQLNSTGLYKANLAGANLSGANLFGTQLFGANLARANLSRAFMGGANLPEADLSRADLNQAVLESAQLLNANLSGANLSGANLSGASLYEAQLVKTDLSNAILTDCLIFGVNVWKVNLDGAVQRNLDISDDDESSITVDNLEVAQFIHLLLNNQRIRDAIDTITSKAVLILGRFTEDRKAVLDTIREELRKRDYLPILFDFEQPSSRNLTETISTLAHIARFVIADITDAKSIPQELQRIIPDLPSLPVQPLILTSEYEYALFKDFLDYPWVLPMYSYTSTAGLLTSLEEKIISPPAAKAKEIEERRKALAQIS